MHRLAASLAAATTLVLAAAAHADEAPAEGPAAPAQSAPAAPDAQRPPPSGDPAQEDDSEVPVVVPVPVEEPRPPVAPIPPPEVPRLPNVRLPQRQAPLPPPMPPSYYQQQVAPERTLAGRTHNLVLPTGELLREGDAEITTHDFIYYRGAVALGDQVELSFSAPIVPLFAQAGLRVGVIPRSSRFKLVVGADGYVALSDGAKGDSVLVGTVTAAYQTDGFNLHATGAFAYAPSGGGALGVTSVGFTWLLSSKVALFAEVSQVLVGDPTSATTFYTQTGGIKLLGDQIDVDLGIMAVSLPDEKSDVESAPINIPIPVVSATKAF